MSAVLATSLADRLQGWLNDVSTAISSLGAIDWLLVAAAGTALAWAWVRARAFVRLGPIEITGLDSADDALSPAWARALLQQELARRGWLPPSGVPTGSPSVAGIADAIAKAPGSEAGWVAGLLTAMPLPPTRTGFQISGTLLSAGTADAPRVQFAYKLVCTGPRRAVELDVAEGADLPEALECASREIYRKIGNATPEMYPAWARWCSTEALAVYRQGLDAERRTAPGPPPDEQRDDSASPVGRTAAYEEAYEHYLAASQLDPDNMLARLRAANCLERMANGADSDAVRFAKQVEALAAYVSIRLRQPALFQAGFRASVLMSILASQPEEALERELMVSTVLTRFERETSRRVDRFDARDDLPWSAELSDWRAGIRSLSGRGPGAAPNLTARLERAAQREARDARRRLRPWGTMRQNRFRHRFEPRGRERRQLRKALGISRAAQRARQTDRLRTDGAPEWRLTLRQLRLRFWVHWRYMAGRWEVAGWQAHYNAACFYSLLPQAAMPDAWLGSLRLRLLALRHLQCAIDQSDGQLDAAYVRFEDPDLSLLRRLSPDRFAHVLRRICPDDLTVHYVRARGDRGWGLHVWGPGSTTPRGGPWAQPLRPVDRGPRELTFRIRVFDENRPVRFLAHAGAQRDVKGWEVVPSQLSGAEVWVYPGDSTVYGRPRPLARRRPAAARPPAPQAAAPPQAAPPEPVAPVQPAEAPEAAPPAGIAAAEPGVEPGAEH